MTQKAIVKILLEKGETLFKARRKNTPLDTGNPEAEVLVNDLANHPHAFVLACVMDRQIKAERAWSIPYHFQMKLDGDFSITKLASLTQKQVSRLMSKPEPLHRFVDDMSKYFYLAVQRIVEQYDGDASNIWKRRPSSATVVYRFLEFEGVGPKIASMAANILARDFKVGFSDYYSIDISADVHVRRVFKRLHLTPKDATTDQLIFKAREINPEFPGLLDFPAWEVGKKWCEERLPKCNECYLNRVCPNRQ